MTSNIEYLHRRLKNDGRGGKEAHVLHTRYNALLPVGTVNLQAKCLYSLRHALSADVPHSLQSDSEL